MPPVAASLIDDLAAALSRHRAGDHAAAEAGYRVVLGAAPHHPQALHLLGLLLGETDRPAEAAALLRRAAVLRPGHLGTRLALAQNCAAAGAREEAAALARAVLQERPRDPAVLTGLARVLLAAGDAPGAAATAAAAAAADPDGAAALLVRGAALRALGDAAAAAAVLEQAAGRDPDDARIRLALGNALADADRPGAAAALHAALRRDPALPEAHASLAALLTDQGRLAEAVAACDAAIACAPGHAPAHWNRAVARLLGGDLAGGFADAEWRKRHPGFAADFAALTAPEWQGEALAGRTLLVHAGQGIGDTLQFARYLPQLTRMGGAVVLACARALVPLLAQVPGIAVVARADGLPPHDVWVDQMSLPLRLGDPAAIPAPEGYLRADEARAAPWRHGVGAALRVGLVWAGNPAHANDRRRSLPPGEAARLLAPLRAAAAALPRLRLLALQTGPRQDELAGWGIPALGGGLADFADTAGLLATIDLVITVDTAVAHLAGALGRPAWVLLPHAPDWRWQRDRADSPWYDSLRLFRQPHAGDWAGAVAAAAAALRGRYAIRRPASAAPARAAVAAL